MSQVTITLYRHAKADSKPGIIPGFTNNDKLSAQGIKDAKELAKQNDFSKYDLYLSSDLERAVETAILLTGLNKNQIIQTKQLREMHFGIFEDKPFDLLNTKGAKYQEVMLDVNHSKTFTTSLPKGESHQDVLDRVFDYLRKEISRADDIKNICIVSHGGVLTILRKYFKNEWVVKMSNLENFEFKYDRKTNKFFI